MVLPPMATRLFPSSALFSAPGPKAIMSFAVMLSSGMLAPAPSPSRMTAGPPTPPNQSGLDRTSDQKSGVRPLRLFSFSWTLPVRSEEHTSELQYLMRISYAVFCLKKTYLLNHKLYPHL